MDMNMIKDQSATNLSMDLTKDKMFYGLTTRVRVDGSSNGSTRVYLKLRLKIFLKENDREIFISDMSMPLVEWIVSES